MSASRSEGEFHVMSGRFEIGGIVFDQWELEELEEVLTAAR